MTGAGDVCGIDLGTSFSILAHRTSTGQVEVVTNDAGDKLTPSVFKYNEEGQIVVGGPAKRSRLATPERVVEQVKRRMGSDWSWESPEGESFTSIGISAEILKKVKNDAQKKVGLEFTKAVITVPAYFTEGAKEATKKAGQQAGLDQVVLKDEPDCGLLAQYWAGWEIDKKTVLVVDIGGGTSDLSLIRCDLPNFRILDRAGDNHLGGIDFTNKIVEELRSEFGPFEDPGLKQQVFQRSERAKKDLSTDTTVTITFSTNKGLESVELTRSHYNDLIEENVDKIVGLAKEALSSADVTKDALDEIHFIGGSTRTPLLQESFAEEFGLEPKVAPQPDLSVAQGALIAAANEEGYDLLAKTGQALPGVKVDKILNHSIGVEATNTETGETINSVLIEEGEPLPATGRKVFSTERDGQTKVRITLLEGSARDPAECTVIGNRGGYVLEGIPPKPQGVARIELKLKITEEGLLEGEARELESGKELHIRHERDELVGEAEEGNEEG
ncbi:Hsp70 family protein [Candidatus Bipolaricaulota bacterium]|nr:Hsp70 family protein [Candidatus Bipolaricaulota bacterium]